MLQVLLKQFFRTTKKDKFTGDALSPRQMLFIRFYIKLPQQPQDRFCGTHSSLFYGKY
jgi:hypothetical protein